MVPMSVLDHLLIAFLANLATIVLVLMLLMRQVCVRQAISALEVPSTTMIPTEMEPVLTPKLELLSKDNMHPKAPLKQSCVPKERTLEIQVSKNVCTAPLVISAMVSDSPKILV